MPNNLPKLSLIIPAKNEEKRIGATLSNFGSYFEARRDLLEIEIIVVVNNSDDATYKAVAEYCLRYPFIKRIETPYSSGKGGAVALGFNRATGDYIGFVDADGAIPASETFKLFNFLYETPWLDGAIGTRTTENSTISTQRAFLKTFYNLMVKGLFNLPYKDTQCGAKIFRRKPALEIAKKLANTGWTFDVNLLLIAKYLNYQILEHEVKWNEKQGSKFSIKEAFFKVPVELLLLRLMQISHFIDITAGKILENDIVRIASDKAIRKKGHGLDTEDDLGSDIGSKNILFLAWRDIKHPEMGGSEVYVHQIAKRLAKRHNVTLFTSQPGNLSNFDEIDGVEIIRKGGQYTVYIWAFVQYFLFLRKNTDLIIDVQNGIPFFSSIYSRKPKIMILHHVHRKQWFREFNAIFATIGYFIEIILMPIFYANVPVVTVSPSSLQELRKIGFSDKNIFIAYNSIPPKTGPKFAESPHPTLVYVGRIKRYKQLEVGVDAVKKLKKDYPGIKLLIGGAGDHLEELKNYVKKNNLQDHVEFLGFISESKKWEILQKGWVFVMPSMQEGWGITIIEAASCETPAVGFDVPGVRDSIRDHLTGLLAADKNDYIAKVRSLIANQGYRHQMKKNCSTWAKNFSWNASTKVFEALITDMFTKSGLMQNKIRPWELDLNIEAITTLNNIKS